MQRLLKRGKRRTHSSSLYPDGLLVLHSFVHMKNKLLCEDQDESLRERERFKPSTAFSPRHVADRRIGVVKFFSFFLKARGLRWLTIMIFTQGPLCKSNQRGVGRVKFVKKNKNDVIGNCFALFSKLRSIILRC